MRPKNTLYMAAAGIGAGLVAREVWRKRPADGFFGRVVLITSGARGLGLAAARLFGAEGARIAICGRDAEDLERARQQLAGRGIDALALRCDITDCAQVEGMVGAALDRFGAIDILVNHAGELQAKRLESVSLEDFEQAMDEMFWGAVYPTRAVLPHMLERRSGRIVNIMEAGKQSAPLRRLAYDCAELAAMGFSEGLRKELAPDGITVISVVPDTGANPELAARQVLSATRRGHGERVLSKASSAAARFHRIFPGAAGELMNRLLESSRHNGNGVPDRESPWRWILGALGRTAARRYLEP
jgi:NAD(P)-dependent dehydrogenase (short-subunit alcohol dehydrogenase family)